jgi:integrase
MAKHRETGHLKNLGDNRWNIVISVRDPATGKRKRRWFAFRGTKKDAQAERRRRLAEIDAGASIEPRKLTMARFLERWLEHMKPNVAPRTHERYSELVRLNIVPLIGGIPLNKLQAADISAAYAKALAGGRADGRGGLSPRTVHHMHRVLNEALRQAVRWDWLVKNPADKLEKKDRPKVERKRLSTFDMAETAQAIEALRPSRMFIPALLGLLCGLRRGEVAALKWEAIDLDRGTLAVIASTEQTKAGCREKETKSSQFRTIALSAFVVEELRQHRLRQVQELLKLGIGWTKQQHVVAQEDGQPLQPRSLTHAWIRESERAGLKRIRLHATRHSHASMMLSSNIHPKIVQERLGHSSIAVTLDIYSDVAPNLQAEAVTVVDGALQAALNRRS